MAKCLWCEKKGFLLKVDEQSLCTKCANQISEIAHSIQRDLEIQSDRIENANTLGSAVAGKKSIVSACEAIRQYEDKGIEVYNIPTGEIINDVYDEFNKSVVGIFENSLGKKLLKLETYKTEKTYYKHYEQYLSEIDEAIEEIEPMENYQKSIDKLNAIKKQFEINFNYRFK